MRAHARAEFARLTYLRAVAAARAEPTPARWDRLLRASRNLKAALEDRDREHLAGGWRGRAPRTEKAASASPPPAPSPSRVAPAGRWPELERELARARALMLDSRRLVAEASALSAELRRLSATWWNLASG